MKNILLGAMLLSSPLLAESNGYFNLKVGAEFGGKYAEVESKHGKITGDTEGLGGSIALEYMKPMNNVLDLGVGMAYQQHADRKETIDNMYWITSSTITGVTYTSVPVYAVAKINIPTNGSFAPYIIGHVGYSFNKGSDADFAFNGEGYWNYELNPDVKDGMYAGIGIGFVYNKTWTFDLMYQVNKAEDENGNNVDYERGVALIGFKF